MFAFLTAVLYDFSSSASNALINLLSTPMPATVRILLRASLVIWKAKSPRNHQEGTPLFTTFQLLPRLDLSQMAESLSEKLLGVNSTGPRAHLSLIPSLCLVLAWLYCLHLQGLWCSCWTSFKFSLLIHLKCLKPCLWMSSGTKHPLNTNLSY